jgi:hypothetical protein
MAEITRRHRSADLPVGYESGWLVRSRLPSSEFAAAALVSW